MDSNFNIDSLISDLLEYSSSDTYSEDESNYEIASQSEYSHKFEINENTPQINQPSKITISLKPHQLAMIYTMLDLEEDKDKTFENHMNETEISTFDTDIGCLCDKVGTGKSLVILGLIATKKLMPIKKKCFRTYGNLIREYSLSKLNLPINLLVVPHGIINQWEKYIQEQTQLQYYGIKNSRDLKESQKLIANYVESGNLEPFTHDLWLISSTNYNKISPSFLNICISRLIIDEVETIRIPGSKYIKSQFTWYISSSIRILQNPKGVYGHESYGYVNHYGNYVTSYRRVLKEKMAHTGYFRSCLQAISNINFREHIYLRSQEEFVKQSFSLPAVKENYIHCKENVYTYVLNGLVNQDVMNMINAGDIKGAIDHSGYDQENEENLVKLLTYDIEKKLENKKIELEGKMKMTYSNQNQKVQTLEKINNEISKLEEKIRCIKSRILETEACPICFDNIQNRVIAKCCGNPFCYECLMLSLNVKCECPLCRNTMNRNDLVLLSTDLDTMPETSDEGGKILTDKDRTKSENLEFYIEKVMNSEGPKSILIFAEYDKPLLEITDFLNAKGYRYSHLKGSSTRIVNIVEKYKKNEIDILLLNSKYFGSGLNLENTTHLFMYHKMIDHLDKQVIGRAQRPGRTQPLELFRLCYSNEAATQSD